MAVSNDNKSKRNMRITTYITPEDYKKISLMALQQNISMSSALHYCIKNYDMQAEGVGVIE